jgi:hypothetical protein
MYLAIRFTTDGSREPETVEDANAEWFARSYLKEFKEDLPNFDDVVDVIEFKSGDNPDLNYINESEFHTDVFIGNSIVWDAFKMLLLTEFPELFEKVKWFVNSEEIFINKESLCENKYVPELGVAGSILMKIIRKRRENRDTAKGAA